MNASAKPAAPVLIGGGYSDRDTQVAIKNFLLGCTADEVLDRAASAVQACGGRMPPAFGGEHDNGCNFFDYEGS
jgi:hypothetical protein